MSTTQPIRLDEDIQKLKNYFLDREEYRNYLLVTFGLNTALRISDILTLKWNDVYQFDKKIFSKYIYITEQKTQKQNQILLNATIIDAIKIYLKYNPKATPEEYLFKSAKRPSEPITRVQAYRIIKGAAQKLGIEGIISCHSLRKTFGYHAWKSGAEPALIMNVYNHSSFQITKRYLGIEQDDKDELFFKINL